MSKFKPLLIAVLCLSLSVPAFAKSSGWEGTTLDELADVVAPPDLVQDGDVIYYNGTTDRWEINQLVSVDVDAVSTLSATSTDNAVARFNGVDGAQIQNSGVIISDGNAITGATSLAVDTEVYDATGWDADLTVPTKDAVRDKIETMSGGDVTSVGDCTDGACLDGTSDGGTYVRLYDGDSHYGAFVTSNLSGNRTYTFPNFDGTMATLAGTETLTGKTLAAASNIIEADTVITNANLSGDVTSSGNTTTIADSVTVTGWVLGTSSATTLTSGTVNIDLLDGVGAVDMDYGSADITDHTFTSDGGTVILDGVINSSTLTASEIVLTDASKNLVSAAVATYPSLTELSYVKGLSSAVQTQLNGKQATLTNPVTGTGTINELAYWTSGSAIGTLAVASYPSLTELSYVKGVTSAIQTQIGTKAAHATTMTIAGTANQITSSAGAQDLSANRTWTLSLPSDVIIPTIITAPNTGLHVLDTNASHDLIIKPGSDLTADKTLTVTTGDADVTLNLTAVTDEYVLAYDTGTNAWRGVVASAGGGMTTVGNVTSGTAAFDGTAGTTLTGTTVGLTLTAATQAATGAVVALTGGPATGAGNAGGAVNITGGLPADGVGGAVVIAGRDGAGTNRNGGAVTITSGAGIGTGNGANILITSGASGTTGTSPGNVTITAGASGAGSADDGGVATLKGGAGDTSSAGGIAQVVGGAGGATGAGGAVKLTAGNGGATSGTGGAVTITAGESSGGSTAGALTITSGSAQGTGAGGALNITSGAGLGANRAGDLNIAMGSSGTTSSQPLTLNITGGAAGTGADVAGGDIYLNAGNGNLTGAGGQTRVYGGNGGTTGAGGQAYLFGGSGGGTSGSGGAVTVQGGPANDGIGGACYITGGNGAGTNRAGGLVNATAGNGIGSATGGTATLLAGNGGVTGAGGAIAITSGSGGVTSGAGGDININGGSANSNGSGVGGAITLTGGTSYGANSPGAVGLYAGNAGTAGRSGANTTIAGGTGNTTGAGGAVNINGGTPGNAGQGGAINLTATAGAGSSTGGVVAITAGAGGATGAGGTITITSGNAGATSGAAGNITITGGDAKGTDTAAGTGITISSTRGTGTGAGGGIIFKVSPAAGGSGSTNNALANALELKQDRTWTGAVYGAGTATFDGSGNITSVSDERMKDIQGSFKAGLKEVTNLDPIIYKYNKASGLDQVGTYAGFSAQNVKKYIPEAVGTDANGYYSLSDRPIIAALVNAVKELQAEITQLKKEKHNA